MDNYFDFDSKDLIKVLVLNSVRCLVCNTVLESKHQHHFVECGCKNQTFNDGGLAYNRAGGKDLNKIENLCKYVIMTEQEYEDMLERKRIKEEEILQQKIAAGLMIEFGGKWVHKTTYKIIMDSCFKLADK